MTKKLLMNEAASTSSGGEEQARQWKHYYTDFVTTSGIIISHDGWTTGIDSTTGKTYLQSKKIKDKNSTSCFISIENLPSILDNYFMKIVYDCSSEGVYDYFSVIYNDKEIKMIGESSVEIPRELMIKLTDFTSGIELRYSKDNSGSKGRDNVRIYNIDIIMYETSNIKVRESEDFNDSTFISYIDSYSNFEYSGNYLQTINKISGGISTHILSLVSNSDYPLLAKIYYSCETEAGSDYIAISDTSIVDNKASGIAHMEKVNNLTNLLTEDGSALLRGNMTGSFIIPLFSKTDILFKYRKDGSIDYGFDGIRITQIDILEENII